MQFGETVPGYDVAVMNEREVRAAAGILLVPGLLSFSTAFQTGNFTATRVMILLFLADFFLRVLVSPRFAPSLILGRLAVRNQEPEYTGAAQKRFAWALGLGIASFMLIWTTVLNLAGPVALLGCVTCIVLLFLESAFGFCLGCAIYNRLWPGRAQLCPGGVCAVKTRAPITRTGRAQLATLAAAALALFLAVPLVAGLQPPRMPGGMAASEGAEACTPPALASFLGHEEKWKRMNGCL